MIKLVESFTMTPELQQEVHQVENASLKESLIKNYAAAGLKLTEDSARKVTLWEMPISRYDNLNANGRIYSKALWERVIKEQQHIWKGGLGLADHPEGNSDGNFKEAAVVWLDMRLDENKVVWGTCAFVGKYGELAEDIIVKGGRVGFSSSGLGDLLEDGHVDPQTFIIERVADIVLNPSQNVFGAINNKKESVSSSTDRQKTESTGPNLQDKGNTRMAEAKAISKLEEKRFRKDIETFLSEADQITDPQAKLLEMEEIASMIETGAAPDLKEAVDKKIADQKTKIGEMLNEAMTVERDFGVKNTKKLKEGVSLLATEVKIAAQEAKDWEKIANVLSESVKTLKAKLATTPSANYAASLVDKIKSLENTLKARDKQISDLKERSHAIVKSGKDFINEAKDKTELLEANLKEANDKLAEVSKKNEVLTKMVKDRNEIIREMQYITEEKVEAARKEKVPNLIPTAKERLSNILNINEKSDVQSYWTDLLSRHGKSISEYRERILRCRSLKEAQGVYLRILPTLNEGADYYASLNAPQGSGVGVREREEIQESIGYIREDGPVLNRLLESKTEVTEGSWAQKHSK